MPVGRKPKPTHLKVVTGNPGKRPLNKREPQPGGVPDKPTFLSADASAIWDKFAPELIRLGILTMVDGPMFGAWCSLVAEFQGDPTGMNASRISQMRALAASFGLDASSRSRLSVKPADVPKSGWDDLAG